MERGAVRGSATRRLVAFTLSAVLVVAITNFGGTPTGAAVGQNHHLLSPTHNRSTAVEGRARMGFTCNDVTGAYRINVAKVQPFADDGVTPWEYGPPWSYPFVEAYLYDAAGAMSVKVGDVLLHQNDTNGLFEGGRNYPPLVDPGACRTGAILVVRSLHGCRPQGPREIDQACYLTLQATLT